MADHDFVVRFRIDQADSRRAHAAEAAAYRQRVKDADAAAKAVSDAATREAAARRRGTADVAAASRAAAKAQADAAKESLGHWDGAAGAVGKFVGMLGGIALAQAGIAGIAGLVDAISESFARARRQAEEAGKFAASYRETLKELAFLKGGAGPDAKVLRADVDFRRETLQDAAAARETQVGFLNAAAIAIDTKDAQGNVVTRKKMTEEDAARAQVFAGRMQARLGGDPASYGNLAGTIPSMEGGMERVTGEDISRRMSQMFLIGSLGKASPASFASQMAQVGGLSATGAYRDPARLAAVGSAISLQAPDQIAHGIEQINRMTSGARLDPTGAPGSEMSPAEYMKSIGVTDQEDDLEILLKMFSDVERAEADYEKKNVGKKFNMRAYIRSKGYGNLTDIGRFTSLYGNREDLRKTLIPLADKMPTMAEANAPFEQFTASVQGQAQAQAVEDDRTKLALGGGAMEYTQTLGRQAFKSLQARDKGITGTYEDWKDSNAVRDEMIEIQREALRARGEQVDVVGNVGGGARFDPLGKLRGGAFGGLFGGGAGTKESADLFYEQGVRIAEKGGDPMGRDTPRVKAAQQETERRLDTWEKMEKSLTSIDRKLNPPAVQVAAPGGANAGPAR